MKRLIWILYIVTLIVTYNSVANCESAAQFKRITLPIDMNKEKQLQLEVDKGHQPWRLDPMAVAHAELVAGFDKNMANNKCQLISETDNEAQVKCKGNKNYIVGLKRLIKTKGIWTATNVQIE